MVSWLLSEPGESTEDVVDALAAGILRMLGLPDDESELIAREELPECIPDESLAALAPFVKAS